jgi:Ser/Thr protein kinase RdoA (MazF antagonist)
MDEAFHVDTQVRRRATLRQARATALAALQQYDVQVANVQFIQISDHITYKVEASAGERYLLRVHSESRSPNAILSELEWLKALNQTGQLIVPEGVANRSGSYITDVGKQKGLHGWVTLMRWVEGEHLSGELTEGHVSNIGKLIARLHEASDNFVPSAAFVRSSWDDKSFQGDLSRLEQHYSNFLSLEEFKLYRQAADKVLADLANLQNSGHEYGIIHADLHVGNLVFH